MKISIAKIAKKKFFVPGIVIGLVVIGWLVFLIGEIGPSEKSPKVEEFTAAWSPKEDYKIVETPEGKFVENEKAGLSFKVPEGWKVEIQELAGGEVLLNLFEQKARHDPEHGFLIEGCGWELGVKDSKTETELLGQKIQDIITYQKHHQEKVSSMIEIIDVGGYETLETIVSDNPKFGKSITLEIPFNGRLYYLETLFVPGGEERCSQEFNNFLKTVLIQ
jgi:hypothetical protein